MGFFKQHFFMILQLCFTTTIRQAVDIVYRLYITNQTHERSQKIVMNTPAHTSVRPGSVTRENDFVNGLYDT